VVGLDDSEIASIFQKVRYAPFWLSPAWPGARRRAPRAWQCVGHLVTSAHALTLEWLLGFDRGEIGARLVVLGKVTGVRPHTDGKPDNGRRAVKCEAPRHDGRPLYPAARMRYIVIRDA
jgi:hypothetical protein